MAADREPKSGLHNDLAQNLLRTIRDLVLELHPQRSSTLRVGFDSDLERDLGLDSLARAELLYRIQRDFKLELQESVLLEADTPRDLLAAMAKAVPNITVGPSISVQGIEVGPAREAPAEARTFTEVLDWHNHMHPDRPHILLWQDAGDAARITYSELHDIARRIAGGLNARGIGPGCQVAIMLPTGADFFYAFFGILYAGAVPVPIYPPMRISALEDHLRRQVRILRNAQASLLVTFDEVRPLAALLKSLVDDLQAIETVGVLREAKPMTLREPHREGATALIQYTSGSTGDPKGVVLTHANLLANVRAMGAVMQATPEDVFVSWLPLYHDMGLIGAWLGSLYFAAPLVIMSPLAFLSRPDRWLRAIHRYRGTLSAAPNFAFELCVRRIADEDIEGLDLNSLRMVTNGAEPVSVHTIERFSNRFAKYGFRREALAPVYGLAESSVGLVFPPVGRLPRLKFVERQPLAQKGLAVPVLESTAETVTLVSCGTPLPGHEIRVVDETGHEVGEREEGRLQFRGPSATSGYFNNPDKTRSLFDGAWLETGDLAFIDGGELYFTDRAKDIIIRAGRNIHPHEVEECVGDMERVRKGCVVVFGLPDTATGTEKVVILAETKETDRDIREELQKRIAETATELLGAPPDDVVLSPPRTVPKTSSGKIRRSAARDLYIRGVTAKRRRPLWWQLSRLAITAALNRSRAILRNGLRVLYAAYFWIVVALLGLLLWPLVVLLPRLAWRWFVLRRFAKAALYLTGLPVETTWAKTRPPAGSVMVTNHSSYLDGLVLAASLPDPVIFVAKQELGGQIVAGLFLKRLHVLLVARTEATSGLENTDQARSLVRNGRTLMFFPEGTLTRMPGLLPFRLGAFAVAVQAQAKVVPVTITGTRSVLREGAWFPRRGRLSLTVGEPIAPDGGDFDAAVRLRDAARAEILKTCGEPDLFHEQVIFTDHGIERVSLGVGD